MDDFEAFYEQTHVQYARLANAILRNQQDREEALQEGWLKIWRHWDTSDTPKREAWGELVMKRTAIDLYRKKHGDPSRRETRKTPHVSFVPFDQSVYDVPDEDETPESVLLLREDYAFVAHVWRGLEPGQRLAIQLSALPHTEIQRRYDIPVYISKNRRKRALEAATQVASRELQSQERKAS